MRVNNKINKIMTLIFIFIEIVLYSLILTSSGIYTKIFQFSSVVLCLIFALTNLRIENRYIISGLIMTVTADFFLVICEPIEQLYGMFFFLIAQIMYFIKIHKDSKNIWLLIFRLLLIILIEIIGYIIIKNEIDLLVIISLAYYGMLFMNIIESFFGSKTKLFSIGLILFILCDTIIGLEVMNDEYVSLSVNSIIYKLLNLKINLAWLFYLPSQVFISLTTNRKEEYYYEI